VRELENLIERAVVLTRDDVIGLTDLPLTLDPQAAEPETGPGSSPRSRASNAA